MRLVTADSKQLVIILIDVQPYFLDSMKGDPEPLLVRLEQLLIVAKWFDLHVLGTLEQPVDRKGQLPARLQNLFPESGQILTKHTYNLCAESSIDLWLDTLGTKQIAVAGGETDVCVLQSVLGLLQRGCDVFVLEDCLYSSDKNVGSALSRMSSAGAISCTYKTLFYELCVTEEPTRWANQRLIADSHGFLPVESLPPRNPLG